MASAPKALSPLLTEPLLQLDDIQSIGPSNSSLESQHHQQRRNQRMSSSSFEWPTEAAERAVLYIPLDNHGGTCHLRYNSLRHLLELVSNEEPGRVLDIMNPDDIIGANIEIKLFPNEQNNNNSDSLCNSGGPVDDRFHNPENESQKQPQTAASVVSNIFQPLSNDLDKIFCRVDTTTDETTAPAIPWDSTASAMLNIFVYPKKEIPQRSVWKTVQRWLGLSTASASSSTTVPSTLPVKYSHRHAAIRRFHVAAAEDFANISTVVRAIRQLAGNLHNTTSATSKPYLVLINPKSGPKKNAERVFDELVQPMLEQAGIDTVKRVTTHPRHAEEILQHESITDYSAIIAMGGDGIVHEILQGLHNKWQQSQSATGASSSSASTLRDAFRDIKLGVIGCGTSNGLAKSLLHANEELCSQLESTFLVCKGKTTWMDLSHYHTLHQVHTSFLTFSWAFVADVDIESERLHFLGAARLDLWAVWRILSLRRYKAKLSYLPPPTTTLAALDSALPPLEQPLPASTPSSPWITIEDKFIVFWVSQVSHAAEETFQSPQSHLQDGVFTIFFIRGGASRLGLLKVLLSIGTGDHVNMPICEFVQCVAYRLEPTTPGSFNDLDGEVIESGPIQGEVMPAALNIFCQDKSKPFKPPAGTSA